MYCVQVSLHFKYFINFPHICMYVCMYICLFIFDHLNFRRRRALSAFDRQTDRTGQTGSGIVFRPPTPPALIYVLCILPNEIHLWLRWIFCRFLNINIFSVRNTYFGLNGSGERLFGLQTIFIVFNIYALDVGTNC